MRISLNWIQSFEHIDAHILDRFINNNITIATGKSDKSTMTANMMNTEHRLWISIETLASFMSIDKSQYRGYFHLAIESTHI